MVWLQSVSSNSGKLHSRSQSSSSLPSDSSSLRSLNSHIAENSTSILITFILATVSESAFRNCFQCLLPIKIQERSSYQGNKARTCPLPLMRTQTHVTTTLISPLFSSSNWKYLSKWKKQSENRCVLPQQIYPLSAHWRISATWSPGSSAQSSSRRTSFD